MSDISKIKVGGVVYSIKDPDARAQDGGGVSDAMATTLFELFKKVDFIEPDVTNEVRAFKEAWGIEDSAPDVPDTPDPEVVVLSRITVVANTTSYNVGTDASELDLTVTAHYSDGNSQIVTGYSISGTVAEGENTFIVTYGEKSATVTVTGEMYYTLVGGIPIEYVGKMYSSDGTLIDNASMGTTIEFNVAERNGTFAYLLVCNAGSPKAYVKLKTGTSNVYSLSGGEERRRSFDRDAVAVAMPVPLDGANRHYCYNVDTGSVLYAGEDTILSHHANINELTFVEDSVAIPEKNVRYVPKISNFGYEFDATGNVVASTGGTFSLTEYIDVSSASTISIYNGNPIGSNIKGAYVWCFSDKGAVNGQLFTDTIYYGGKKENITIPTGTKYIRFGVSNCLMISKYLEVLVK